MPEPESFESLEDSSRLNPKSEALSSRTVNKY